MALRLSGRFNMNVATPESIASWMVVYAMQEGATESTDHLTNDSSNLAGEKKTPCTWLRFQLWLAAARQAASKQATPLRERSGPQPPSRSEYCRPERLVRRDILRGRPGRNQTGSSPHRKPRPPWLQPDRAGCAGARRFRDSQTSR